MTRATFIGKHVNDTSQYRQPILRRSQPDSPSVPKSIGTIVPSSTTEAESVERKSIVANEAHDYIDRYIDSITEDLWRLNKQIHDNPETAFNEHQAHDAVTAFLEAHDHYGPISRHAYGLDTAFEAISPPPAEDDINNGVLVNFNAEYDALPGLGHACGHNLICIASVAAYMALARYLRDYKQPGRAQLLGTPAEEGGGGKIRLLEKGAYKRTHVSLMAHPAGGITYPNADYEGAGGQSTLANCKIFATFTGRSAHAAADPWNGINALDALVASYNNVSLLRQQIRPDQRIHGAIQEAPTAVNVIPSNTKIAYEVRASSIPDLTPLLDRVEDCIHAGALATGCTVSIDRPRNSDNYADVKINNPLSTEFAVAMSMWGMSILPVDPEPMPASTDMGNVSHAVPGLHAMVKIPLSDQDRTAFPHNAIFERASGTRQAFERFVLVAKALALVGTRMCIDESFQMEVNTAFARD